MSKTELTQFCEATVATLFSASTPERECQLDGIETSVLLGEQTVTCEQAAQDCLLSFTEVHVYRCETDIEEKPDCQATVSDGEQCSFATASIRPGLLPDATCASDLSTKQAAIAGLDATKKVASTPECERYVVCRHLL